MKRMTDDMDSLNPADRGRSPVCSKYETIYGVVRQIPDGKVATYGQIAAIAGLPRHARLVGYALFRVDKASDIPWHRVINVKGEISQSPFRDGSDDLQRVLLEAEGIRFDRNGKISLRRYGWQPHSQNLQEFERIDPAWPKVIEC